MLYVVAPRPTVSDLLVESNARIVHHEVFFTPIVDTRTALTLVGRPEREYRRKVSVAVAQSLEEAVRAADLFVERKVLQGFQSRVSVSLP
jgi:hypothetical protein